MFAKTAIAAVRWVSSFFRALGWRACRFHPTCSSYAVQAFEELSFLEACGRSLGRLFRCHPFCKGGFDPLWKEER